MPAGDSRELCQEGPEVAERSTSRCGCFKSGLREPGAEWTGAGLCSSGNFFLLTSSCGVGDQVVDSSDIVIHESKDGGDRVL